MTSPAFYWDGKDPWLNNIATAMQYNPDTGKPEMRVSLGSETINITGPVTIPGTIEISNDVGNAIPVTTNFELTTVGFNPVQTDAFGRFRVSNPYTLFDTNHRYYDSGKADVYTANGGSSSHNSFSGTIQMNVTTTANSQVIRETTRVFSYQPGKSLLVLQTFCMAPSQTNLLQRIGYYDTENGFFLQKDGNQISLVKRSISSGTVTNTTINQSNWNVDTMDGTGPSGITLDFNKSQILWHDIEWLGVGTVRAGFVINGKFYPVHYWHHANIITTTYMTSACLPLRVEILNTGITSTPSSFTIICSSVISEGGFEPSGRPRSAGHSLSAPRTISTTSGLVPLFSMRLKSTRKNAVVFPLNFTIAPAESVKCQFFLIKNAVTSGGLWVDAGSTDSSVEYNLTATSYTGGIILETGYIMSSNQAVAAPSLQNTPFKYQLERDPFSSATYEFTVAATILGENKDIYASVEWDEVS